MPYPVRAVVAAIRAVEPDSLTVSQVLQLSGWRSRRKAAAALVAAGYWRKYATSTLPPRTIDGSIVYDRRL